MPSMPPQSMITLPASLRPRPTDSMKRETFHSWLRVMYRRCCTLVSRPSVPATASVSLAMGHCGIFCEPW